MFSSGPIMIPSHLSAFVSADGQNLNPVRSGADNTFLSCLPSATSDSIHPDVDSNKFNPCELTGINDGNISCSKQTSDNLNSQFICEDCGKGFSERAHLQRHRGVHLEPKHICEICGRSFVREDKLKRHIRCVHSQERPFVCDVCAKAFARKDKLQEHARHHNREITFTCAFCSEVFVMRSHLNRHLRSTHNFKAGSAQSAENSLVIPDTLPSGVTPDMLSEQIKIATTRKSQSSKPRKSRKVANLSNQSTPDTSNPNSSQNMPGNSIFGTQSQVPVQLPTNLLFYQQSMDRFPNSQHQEQLPQQQQQQQHEMLQQHHQQQQASIRAVAAAAGYGTTDFSNQQQQQQQAHYFSQNQLQQQPYSSQTALSAAMAARLFSQANYVGWWPQATSNLMFQGSANNQTSQDLQYAPGSSDPSVPTADSSSTRSANTTLQSPVPNQPQILNTYSLTGSGSDDSTVRPAAAVAAAAAASAQMFASFPSLAHAVYYQAASLAASHNGSTSAIPPSNSSSSTPTTGMPNIAHCNQISYNSYDSMNLETS